MHHLVRSIVRVALLTVFMMTPAAIHGATGPSYAVYLRLADGPAGSYDAMVAAVPALAGRAGMEVLASYTPGTAGCRYHATVFVLSSQQWTTRVLGVGTRAAFAAPLRLSVYEDEMGVHLAIANPQSFGRTIVSEEFDGPATAIVDALAAAVRDGYPATPVRTPYGQLRDQGLITRTMGIVAGGRFASKIEEVIAVPATATLGVPQVVEAIAQAGRKPTTRWGLRLIYRYDLPGGAGTLLGFSGEKMEAQSFAIVGKGLDESRRGYACAGLDHAPAYPIEVLVTSEGNKVRVLLTDVMFRMKMYFEDAGKMKFAANMAMPGSIEDELRDLIDEALVNPLGRPATR